ncbi:hypothetical protein [Phyllobacterium myrsinacearum]|uniref:Uncharacterized protein n=1 Tax=Phyllobacterium myrsinacearum TaxID=28101 RepID=A0A839EMI1_9HYPH|nr:hypothetical protein [Phyllobacterium myrsinacearum]MBA8881783.1 hypothetical protein [Phyllobacterium myrsinacearum]
MASGDDMMKLDTGEQIKKSTFFAIFKGGEKKGRRKAAVSSVRPFTVTLRGQSFTIDAEEPSLIRGIINELDREYMELQEKHRKAAAELTAARSFLMNMRSLKPRVRVKAGSSTVGESAVVLPLKRSRRDLSHLTQEERAEEKRLYRKRYYRTITKPRRKGLAA